MNIEKVIVNSSRVALTAENLAKMFKDIDFCCTVYERKDRAIVVEIEDPSRDVIDLVTDKLDEIGVEGFVEEYEEEDANNDTVTNWREGRFTYRKVLEALQKMSPEQLDCDAMIYDKDADETFGLHGLEITQKTDVLDKGHPFFTFSPSGEN